MWGFSIVWGNWSGFSGFGAMRFVVDTGLYGGSLFRLVVLLLLVSFIFVRLPLVCGFGGLFFFLFVYILALFFSALVRRLEDCSLFFAEFVPEGVSVSFAIFVSMLEFVSYLTRPLVLVLRPLVNLGFGWFLSDVYMTTMCCWGVEGFEFNIIGLCFSFLGVMVVFIYEWCVSCVQWYIVEKIVVSESES